VLAAPGLFRAVQRLDCRLELVRSARPLKHRAPVHFHSGTAEIQAEVRLLGGAAALQPGSSAYAQIVLQEPALLLPGDRFIVRMFSPVVTIGGGVVIDIDAPPRIRRAHLDQRLEKLRDAAPAERIALLVAESKFGMSAESAIARTGLLRSEIGSSEWLTDEKWKTQKIREITSLLSKFHRENPLKPGILKEELRSRELGGSPPFLLNQLLASGTEIVVEGDHVRLASHKVALKEDESQALEKVENAFKAAGLEVPSVSEVLAKSGVDTARARTLLQILIRNRKLIRIGDDLIFHASALDRLRSLLAPRKGSRFSVSDFKTWTNVSRKYAIPLLEFLDRERVTRREGDSRIVL